MGGSVSAALDALLARYNVGLTSGDIVYELDAAFAAIPVAGAAPLSSTEAEFLRAHAGLGAEVRSDLWLAEDERHARARIALRELAATVSGSVSISGAAVILGVEPTYVSRLIGGNALWAFALNGNRRIPRWQFLDGRLLPGLAVIAPFIPARATPVVVEAFMHTVQPDFGDRAPVEYLAAGGDPHLVAGFLEDLGRW